MKTDGEIAAYLAGALDETACAEFETEAVADAELRRRLLDQRCVSESLRALLGDSSDLENGILCALAGPPVAQSVKHVAAETIHTAAVNKVVPLPTNSWVRWTLAAAAVLVAAAVIVAAWPSHGVKQNRVALPGQDLAVNGRQAMPLTIDSGTGTLDFANGARVTVYGPARVETIGPAEARLLSGRLVAFVPPAARGFAVQTTAGRVVDLGTRFGVSTGAEDSAEVHVFEGKVEVTTRQQQLVQLIAGEAAALDPVRGVAARLPANEAKFVMSAVQPAGEHLDNPFVGATFYRNVDYTAAVNAAADLEGGVLG
jgi:hypothetical protein